MKNIVLHGDTFGSILASVQVDSIGKDIVDAGIGYNYKESLPVSMLGLVDDIIGVTEAGFKSQQMNVILNVKTSEKVLQFGVTKCKSMIVGKNIKNAINNELLVDGWKETFVDNIETGECDLVDEYIGEIPIGETEEQTYLGFILSCKGDNMGNNNPIQKKAIGVLRTIMNKLDSLKFRYFECSILLRGSIFFASEIYYNLK